MKFGRKFVFAIVSIICVSVTCIMLSYPPAVYSSMVLGIVGLFGATQAVTDIANGKKESQ